ncbi:MAG: hypothetical protein PHV07_01885, partial [Oscillospiraceae bacterium]|nr:hypothetical protein [Oscillospiraceae bacterium]
NSPISETLEDRIKILLASIAAEETRLSSEIQATIKTIKSASNTTGELFENNLVSIIATLIQKNSNIEQELKDSIKKEMDFQLDLENLLNKTPDSTGVTENTIHDSEYHEKENTGS